MKVILDANIIIGFLLTRGYILSSIFEYWENNVFKLLISDSILEEYSLILKELIEKGILNKQYANSLMRKIRKKALVVKVVTKLKLSPDKKDNRYLECSKDGKADYLITRDNKHLSIIRKFKYTKIIGAKQFLEILSGLDYKN
jgi:putative PIN family toxin of toxin-antitoxin system